MPGNEHAEVEHVATGWQRADDFLVDHALARRALDVDDWRFACDRDRLFERAYAHLDINADAVNAPVRLMPSRLTMLKPGSEKVTVYGAGTQFSDAVLPAPSVDGGADLLDECRARRFDGHARQHRA